MLSKTHDNPPEEDRMRLYAAIDLHSNNGVLVIIDESDKKIYERRLPNELRVALGELAP